MLGRRERAGNDSSQDARLAGQEASCLRCSPHPKPSSLAQHRARSIPGAPARNGEERGLRCCFAFTCLGVMEPPKINPASFTRPLRGSTWAGSGKGEWEGGHMHQRCSPGPRSCIPHPSRIPPAAPEGCFIDLGLAITWDLKAKPCWRARLGQSLCCYRFPGGD